MKVKRGPLHGVALEAYIYMIYIYDMILYLNIYECCTHGVFITFSPGAGVISGGASENKIIPMAECTAYGILATYPAEGRGDVSVSRCLAYGVLERQQMREVEDDGYETVQVGYDYEPMPK